MASVGHLCEGSGRDSTPGFPTRRNELHVPVSSFSPSGGSFLEISGLERRLSGRLERS